MKRDVKRTILLCLTALAMLLLCACGGANTPAAPEDNTPASEPVAEEPAASTWKVTFYDSGDRSVLAEEEVADGETVSLPELERENYVVEGFYATPALKVAFDETKPIIEDTSVFVAWRSSMVDERPWMLAGSLKGYPENNWGKAWPQDDYLLQPVEGEFNTFAIEVNLYEGDAFKIAVIGEGYVWDNASSIDARHLADKSEDTLLSSGENAFDSGANIQVNMDGRYRLILRTDAETLSLCALSYERLGDAEELNEISYDMKLWASFNNWEGQDMTRNGDDLIWYIETDVPEDGEFGVLNAATGDWYSSEENTKNIEIAAGHYLFFIELELRDGTPVLKDDIVYGEPAYYVVGTCGNGGWAADVTAENADYQMTEQDGKYVLTLTVTEDETVDWAGDKVAVKVACGVDGRVPNDQWYGGEDGDNILLDPGTYTVTFDPATGAVTVA